MSLPYPWQLASQPLRNAYDVVFTAIQARWKLLVRTSQIDALEGGMASLETKRRCRRLVNDSIFADRKLIGHNWRGHPLLLKRV